MPHTFLIFDFGANEDAAQQARHRLEAWKQALRLGDRLQFKFERQAAEPPAAPPPEPAPEPEKKKKPAKAKTAKSAKTKAKTKKKEEPAAEPAAPAPAKEPSSDRLRVLVRLEFSDHEKLSHQRWLDRIPAEPPFPAAEKQIVRRGQEGFDQAAKVFDELP